MPKREPLVQFLKEHSHPIKSEQAKRFFKTEPGSYGEKDLFLGISTPTLRKGAKLFADLNSLEIRAHLSSPFNEERLIALFILTERYKREKNEELVTLYIEEIEHVNNWNLVDSSAHLMLSDFSLLKRLAVSENLWKRRIAIVATLRTIREGNMQPTQAIAKLLLQDKEDLIHKAVGWMLREMGKKNPSDLETFLKQHAAKMPRTMLRYAIERLPPTKRSYFLTLN